MWSGRGRKPKYCEEHTGPTTPKAPRMKACGDCGADVPGLANRRYCDACSARRRALKTYAGCEHEKPRFANGKERKFCFACVPKPPPKPRKKNNPANYRMAEPAVCAAPGCGQGFTKKLPYERFCSDQCRNRASNRAGQERRRNSKPRPCRWCGTVYVPEYGSLRTHYCTTACRDAGMRKLRSGSTHRRRAAKFGCDYEPVSKRSVFERDGWRCYLCGCETPKHLSGTTEPNAPELDHVVPLAKGGPHTYRNVRCACRACNRDKGARLLEGARTHATGDTSPMMDGPEIEAPVGA